jgi:hypothetical protein
MYVQGKHDRGWQVPGLTTRETNGSACWTAPRKQTHMLYKSSIGSAYPLCCAA